MAVSIFFSIPSFPTNNQQVFGKVTYCRPVINESFPFKGLRIRIPVIISIKGRGFINKGSTLAPAHAHPTDSLPNLAAAKPPSRGYKGTILEVLQGLLRRILGV